MLPSEVTAAGASGRVLEVAAAEAVHACKLNLRGLEAFVVEPSDVMLARAAARREEYGARVTLIRGVAETLPFSDQTFDRVLIDSAIDHLGQPERSIGEMTRVLKADGRLVISFVNYQSVSTRLSRLLYRIGRRLHLASPREHFFWDSPVPIEHTFECTYDALLRICRPHLELDHVFGVSMGWNVPGWGTLLQRLPWEQALAVMHRLDRFASRRPRLADFVVTVWRPRPLGTRSAAATTDDGFVRPTDVVYPGKVAVEAAHWAQVDFRGGFSALVSGAERAANEAYTGDPARSWIDDLAGRGPFRDAAALGCDEEGYESYWLRRNASERLDVYELSEGVIRKVRDGLGLGWWATHGPARRVRFIRADLNVARLPASRYDVIWSSGCLHHVTDLEYLFAEVERALRPGGLFAIHDYVGEPRMQFAPARLARINAVLEHVPARYRRVDAVVPPTLQRNEDGILRLSPFCGVRSNEILPLAESRFEVLHKAVAGALFPLNFVVDLGALEREAPEVLAKIHAAEREALREPGLHPCGAYVVLRKRAHRGPRTVTNAVSQG